MGLKLVLWSHLGIWWRHAIWIFEEFKFEEQKSQEQKELLKWNKKHFSLFQQCSPSDLQNKYFARFCEDLSHTILVIFFTIFLKSRHMIGIKERQPKLSRRLSHWDSTSSTKVPIYVSLEFKYRMLPFSFPIKVFIFSGLLILSSTLGHSLLDFFLPPILFAEKISREKQWLQQNSFQYSVKQISALQQRQGRSLW